MRHDGKCDRNRWSLVDPQCPIPATYTAARKLPGEPEFTWCEEHKHPGDVPYQHGGSAAASSGR